MIKSTTMRRRKPEELSLNLTPLIDVVFLLLIFFMVTTSFKQSDQLGVELPQTQSKQANQTIQGIQLSIGADGGYYLGEEALGVDLKLLRLRLKQNFATLNEQQQQLYLLGDKLAPHQAVVSAMDVAQSLGITRIKIMTEHNDN